MFGSRSWRALMRRNVLYRRRHWLASLFEMALPVLVTLLVLLLKNLTMDAAPPSTTVPPDLTRENETYGILTFSDYVTAIVAERICYNTTVPSWNQRGMQAGFAITGIAPGGYDWQVPFVRCDSRNCQQERETAYKYCIYPHLAVAPASKDDGPGKQRAQRFQDYVNNRWPQLLNKTMTHFREDFELVKLFDSNEDIETYIKDVDYGQVGKEEIALAVIFEGDDALDYKFSLRVNSTGFNSPEREGQPGATTTPQTKKLFETFAKEDLQSCPSGGRRSAIGVLGNSCTGKYMYNGLLTVQRLVQDWIMEESGAKDAGYFTAEHGVRYNSFPTKKYETLGAIGTLAQFLPILMTLGIMYPCAVMVSYVVQEKQLRQKELMKMMSVTESDIGWSWFMSFWIFHIITATLVWVISGSVFENSSKPLTFVFWQLSFLSFVVLSLFIAAFTSKTTRGVLVGVLVVLGGYFLTLAADIRESSRGTIGLISLHPVAAFSFGIQEIGRLEDTGSGVSSGSFNVTDSPSGYTFANVMSNLLFSTILLGILTWYFNRIIAPDYGQAMPCYFPCSYWGWFCASNDDSAAQVEGASQEDSVPVEPVSDSVKQQAQDGKSVEIKNLRKAFDEKIAVDGLNLSMYKGQITALLGHNGAGKSTTISMLTGALSPTEGHAVILGKDIRTQMNKIREDIGICLQHDCLFPRMTVREHVQFFARLKGMYNKVSWEEAEASVDQAIRDVALEEKSNTFSKDLSGGMKRKLSLAMAFCGGGPVVFLDEPTSGMDPFSRRFSWNVIRQYRQNRIIILTTHFMDEADILGDRIAIMAEGRLRCCGSSLFLKKTFGVGYQLTIEKKSKFKRSSTGESEKPEGPVQDDKAVGGGIDKDTETHLKQIVQGAVSEASLLSSVGTELSFQLPLNAANKFVSMLKELDGEIKLGKITTYGVSITTLDEVFLLVARGEDMKKTDFQSSHVHEKQVLPADEQRSVRSRMDLENENLLRRHVGAMFKKRAANFKRDKKAWCCTTILPSLFVLIGLLLLKFVSVPRNLDPLPLKLDDYNVGVEQDPRNPIPFNNPDSVFPCSPGRCSYNNSRVRVMQTGEKYYFCGSQVSTLPDIFRKCTISESTNIIDRITAAGATGIPGDVSTIYESSEFVFYQLNGYIASQYGAIFFTHDTESTTGFGESYGDMVSKQCANDTGDYLEPSECERYGQGMGYVISYNFTALHISPLFQSLADEAIIREGTGETSFKISPSIHPLPITTKEESIAEGQDTFSLWFLVVLSFPFIGGAFSAFVVEERNSKAKHLQTVAGVAPSAYWVSTFLWDFFNYLIPFAITIILIFAFDVTAFTTTERNAISGTVAVLLLFGPASASFSYCVSFLFKSPSLCTIFLIISGFLVGMGGPIACLVLRLIGNIPGSGSQSLVTIADVVGFIGRLIPSFCLGSGLLNLINIESISEWNGGKANAWDGDVVLYDVIYLAIESVLYLLLAIYIDRQSSNPNAMLFCNKLLCRGQRSNKYSEIAQPADDDDVMAEQERVLSGDVNNDAIVLSELTKIYGNGKIAVNKMSLGIAPGECFGLLGVNGAGKSSTMGILTAEFPPSSGDATLAGFSVRNEPEKTRRRIGYCPQFDAHFSNLTGREHVELYASVKGIPSAMVKDAAADKLKEVGLSDKDSDRLTSNYSGGMKRRLSLACATIGQPELVFLDECSTGVDPVARREIWQMVSDLVSNENVPENERTSVILTTHSMDECEALCPRIGIMANGRLRCLGSAQHLKSKFGNGYQAELRVAEVTKDDEDFKQTLVALAAGRTDFEIDCDDPDNLPDTRDIYFNLEQAKTALRKLTGDDYLAGMLNEDNHHAFAIYKDCTSPVGAEMIELADFAAEELRMLRLHKFVTETYTNRAILRERQDMKARYEVASNNIAHIFESIESNKEALCLSDYGVSQTSLEQVFNMHAAEAEKLKQGKMDN